MTAGDGWAFPFIQFGLIEKFLLLVRQTHESDVSSWRIAPECSVAVGGSADIGMRWRPEGSVANDLGCVKTLRGITAPGILGSTVTRRVKKRKNLSSARHYDQIRFRFHTAKTHLRHGVPCLWHP